MSKNKGPASEAQAELRAPLAEAMQEYAAGGALAFHTPGHKQGKGAHHLLRRLITEEGLRQEVSLMSELDDLAHPDGCIAEAQKLAAELYGARQSFFMINGTTGAIHTMLMAALSPGDVVLLPRNAHRSVWGGLVLAGARPVWLQPEVDSELGIAEGLSLKTVREAIEQHPEAKALVAVHPTYYGVTSRLREIAELLHQNGMLLLVDEAHGAHLHFSAELPEDALAAGADLVAQSTHKLVGSLTQTSMLHLGSERVPYEKVRRCAGLLSSTSANYLLLASLDIARLQLAEKGPELVGRSLELARKARKEINRIKGLFCFGPERMGKEGADALDETKLTVNVSGLKISGAEAERFLRWQEGLQIELADARNILFLLTLGDGEAEIARLLEALRHLSDKYYPAAAETKTAAGLNFALPAMPRTVLTPRQAFYQEQETVCARAAAGRISAEEITFYPPGIPLLVPGEEITDALLEYSRALLAQGLHITGVADSGLETLRVIREA